MFHPGNHAPNGVFSLQVNKSVTSINLRSNKIGPEGASSLAKALEVLPRNVASLFGLRDVLRTCLYSKEDVFMHFSLALRPCVRIDSLIEFSLMFDPVFVLF